MAATDDESVRVGWNPEIAKKTGVRRSTMSRVWATPTAANTKVRQAGVQSSPGHTSEPQRCFWPARRHPIGPTMDQTAACTNPHKNLIYTRKFRRPRSS
jgi:hypothetical protein